MDLDGLQQRRQFHVDEDLNLLERRRIEIQLEEGELERERIKGERFQKELSLEMNATIPNTLQAASPTDYWIQFQVHCYG